MAKMGLRITSYRIDRIEFICECPRCGWPSDEGDTAFAIVDRERFTLEAGFCCRAHGDKALLEFLATMEDTETEPRENLEAAARIFDSLPA